MGLYENNSVTTENILVRNSCEGMVLRESRAVCMLEFGRIEAGEIRLTTVMLDIGTLSQLKPLRSPPYC